MHNFNKALIRIGILAVILLVISVLIMRPYFNQDIYYYQDRDLRESYAGQLDTLIVGSSEGLRGLEPTVLDRTIGTCSYNLSNVMMTMCGRYTLMKYEISRNPVDTVILELSYESMSRDRENEVPQGDVTLLGRLDTPWQRISFIAEAFPLDELPWLYYDTLTRGIECIEILANDVPHGPYEETILRKGFVTSASQDVSLTQEEYLRMYHTKSIDTDIELYNVQYLQRISDLCREEGIELIIVTLPQARTYTTEYADLQVVTDYYRDFAEANGWVYYDFNLLIERDTLLTETEAFNDMTHLSHPGAWDLTELLGQLMMMEDAGEDTSALFYETHAEMDAARGYIRDVTE